MKSRENQKTSQPLKRICVMSISEFLEAHMTPGRSRGDSWGKGCVILKKNANIVDIKCCIKCI